MRSPARTLRRLLPVVSALTAFAPAQPALPGTSPLTLEGDLSAQMVAGIHRYLDAEGRRVAAGREEFWQVNFSSRQAYETSVAPNRARLARMLGVVDARVPAPQFELVATTEVPALVAETDLITITAVRWPVLPGVHGEGLLLRPRGRVLARVVALPDADQTPEMIAGLSPGLPATRQYARRLAENGCEVVVPALLDRTDMASGNPAINRRTNQPHREWIYRQAFALGRHPLGYEVQKVLAAVEALASRSDGAAASVGVAGWGEGALLAFLSAALDARLTAAAVSGHFGPREQVAAEPVYRNLFGLLREFGDAEIARLIVPRALFVEQAPAPEIAGPPAPRPGFMGAAPGRLSPPSPGAVQAEFDRARRLAGPWAASLQLASGANRDGSEGSFSEDTLQRFVRALDANAPDLRAADTEPRDPRPPAYPIDRQRRVVGELQAFTQGLVPGSRAGREEFLWKKIPTTSPAAWQAAMRPYREKFWNEIIGRVRPETTPLRPRSRLILDRPAWTAHEVVLDVLPEVFAWGLLLWPKDLKPGERRPVIVAQHGLEGLPADLIEEDRTTRAYGSYKAFAARLAERGFIVFAPHNPYRGDQFRQLQRKAHPLGLSIFAVITAQHERILDWLAQLPHVDPARIGFYGLSYGGSTAMRVPALLERYAAVVCSGNFNEWVWKLSTTDWTGSYVFTKEYEMPEFNLGSTFGHAEMAALIAPRPFMVERGHADGVGLDEWVGFEYAKVKRLYDRLKIPERTEIEFFDGPHTIHGVGTFAFFHRHLQWPEPAEERK